MSRPERRRTISVDFDGVLHAYTTREYPFDPLKVLDPPVPGMMAWLIGLARDPRFKVVIFSTRNTVPNSEGIRVMLDWLHGNGVPEEITRLIDFPLQKPPAHVMIDDRAIEFKGRPIPIEEILEFRPWNRA